MTLAERLEGLNVRALLLSVIAAGLALAALTLLIDRLERIAKSKPFEEADREWRAPTGYELRLAGLEQGPLVAVETSPGGGVIVRAPRAMLAEGGTVRRLVWLADARADNKSEVQVSMIGSGGSVTLSRSGEASMPQLLVRVADAKLLVESGVTVGDSRVAPSIKAVFGQQELPPRGLGFSFVVPAGGSVAIELPDFPDDTPSGVVTWLGTVREEQEDAVLPVREVGIAREGAAAPDRAACATSRRYAWSLFFRPALFPVPTGKDCAGGSMTAREFSITKRAVAVSLAGSAWQLSGGMPIGSLWSWAKSNDVLSLVINKLLPGAVSLILGILTWRRGMAAGEPAAPKKKTPSRKRSPAKSRPRRAH